MKAAAVEMGSTPRGYEKAIPTTQRAPGAQPAHQERSFAVGTSDTPASRFFSLGGHCARS